MQLSGFSISRLWLGVRLVWRYAPGWTVLNGALSFVQGLILPVTLYLIKLVIDTVTATIAHGSVDELWPALVWYLALLAGLALVGVLCRGLAELASEAQSFQVTDGVLESMHAQAVAVDLAFYEDSRYHDTAHRAQQEAVYRPARIVNALMQAVQTGISLLGVGSLLVLTQGWLAFALLLVLLPSLIAQAWFSRKLHAFTQNTTEQERQAWYYHWLLSSKDHAKELRLYGLGQELQRRYRQLRLAWRTGRMRLSRQRFLLMTGAQGIAAIAPIAALAFAIARTFSHQLSVGSLVLFFQGVQSVISSLQSLLRTLASLYEDSLFLAQYEEFMSCTPRITAPPSPRQAPLRIERGIEFRNVTFTYPSRHTPALQAVNLSIPAGYIVACVGENGAGKTTLIKLLSRLYDPDVGTIYVDGIDLREFGPEAWRRHISVVSQDFARYAMTARDNIWMGDVAQPMDESRICTAAERAGADALIARLPQGYDSMLNHIFSGGRELSGGEWQKIALARALLRKARLHILDEPTSGLDPLSEVEFFARFRENLGERSAVLISHRFSSIRVADLIYVLADGQVVEFGSHDDLLLANGRYARMYQAQAL